MTLDDETRKLAAAAYGEGSTDNVFEEMAALASVLLRQSKAGLRILGPRKDLFVRCEGRK